MRFSQSLSICSCGVPPERSGNNMNLRSRCAAFDIFAVALMLTPRLISASKIIPMKDFEPHKTEGKWYMQRLNNVIVSDIHNELECINVVLKHDPQIQDLYSMSSSWFSSDREYQETHFAIVDDRSEKARFFFESQKDKLAVAVLGTDYDNWLVAYGASLGTDSYFVASRAKLLPREYTAAVEETLRLNEVTRNWIDIINDDRCPAGH